ncbi:hypothetical protein [Mariniplasma anaerobium]|uniref:Uncharacterized protein n=1 Tax=Mariniplasma anaerobium TaxID=2735436 RepID=A0A7U9TKR3_9MOLU|nr:hypothetical protein [Mariniplasma anaerobium]BCR36747.1 hypothetical protein MPAN_016400 [Mariniplasma anaerobium]
MEFWDGYDLGFDQGFMDGYDLGFKEGSWQGYFFAIDKLKQLRVKREVLIVTATIVASVPLTLLGAKVYKRIKAKSKGLVTT